MIFETWTDINLHIEILWILKKHKNKSIYGQFGKHLALDEK